MINVVQLKTKADDEVLAALKKLVATAESEHITCLACVLIAANGTAYASTRGGNNRLQLLGAVHDLAHTLHTQGEIDE